jgi:protein-disulfide isomerase
MNDDMKEASALGVTGTPGFFINGRFVSGAKPFSEFKIVIDEELKEKG